MLFRGDNALLSMILNVMKILLHRGSSVRKPPLYLHSGERYSINLYLSSFDWGVRWLAVWLTSRVVRLRATPRDLQFWPSGLRRQFKALVFGRGFESRRLYSIPLP